MTNQSSRKASVRKRVPRREDYLKSIVDYLTSEAGRKLADALHKRRFTVGDTGATYRVVNSWEKAGIVLDPRPDGTGWRTYDLVEVAWLHVIGQLRDFGVGLNMIIEAGVQLHKVIAATVDGEESASVLEHGIALVSRRIPVFVLVFSDGSADTTDYGRYQQALTQEGLPNHLVLNLNSIIQEILAKSNLEPKYPALDTVSEDEGKVLSILRTGGYHEVTVRMRDGQIVTIEAEEALSDRRISDILRENDFQEITVKRHGGKTVRIDRRLKMKLG